MARSRSLVRRGLFQVVLVLTALLAAGAGIFAFITYQSEPQPGDVVQSYLTAVSRGNAAQALSYGDIPPGPQGLLTDQVLRQQNSIAPMTGITAIAVKSSGRNAAVTVQYTLGFDAAHGGPQQVTDVMSTVRVGRRWQLVAVAVARRVTLTQAAERAELAGHKVPTESELYFPGALPLTFEPATLQTVPDQAGPSPIIRYQGATLLTVRVQLTAQARTTVWSALNSALKACLAGTAANPASCPLPAVRGAVPGTLRGTSSGVTLDMTATVLNQADGAVKVQGQAVVTGRYDQLDSNNLPVSTPFAAKVTFTARSSAAAPGTVAWDLS
jgi:hypothetical protein